MKYFPNFKMLPTTKIGIAAQNEASILNMKNRGILGWRFIAVHGILNLSLKPTIWNDGNRISKMATYSKDQKLVSALNLAFSEACL